MTKFIFPLLVFAFFSCNNQPKEDVKKTTPDFFGWADQNISNLKRECLERYGKDQPKKKESQKENYCNCMVEKIIYSVKFDQYKSPSEETATLFEEFSKACNELTKNEE